MYMLQWPPDVSICGVYSSEKVWTGLQWWTLYVTSSEGQGFWGGVSSVLGLGGIGPLQWGPMHHVDRLTDTHDWKHYLPAAPLMDGKYQLAQITHALSYPLITIVNLSVWENEIKINLFGSKTYSDQQTSVKILVLTVFCAALRWKMGLFDYYWLKLISGGHLNVPMQEMVHAIAIGK